MTASSTSRASASTAAGDSRRWWGLVVVSLAQLMIVLDITIVNIALPTIQNDLEISATDRQWVVTAYTLAFGGLLLLGGRVADYIGRKRAFLTGLAGFAAASILGGGAVNLEMLLVARAAQGVFGALLAPTALALLSTTFRGSRERGVAFAVFGAIIGSGAVLGLTLGGALTEYLSWQWVFYVNVPIAIVATIAGVFVLDESRIRDSARFDVIGAVLATAGLVSLVYGFSEAGNEGWDAPLTLSLLIGGAGLLVIFVLTEALVGNPLLPLRVVAHRGRGGAFLSTLLAPLGMFGMFFFLSFYLQGVKSYTPLETGLAFLPMIGGVLVTSMLASRVMNWVVPRLLVGTGLLVAAGGMAWLTQITVDSGYAEHVLGPLIVVGLGLGLVFPVATNLATFGVDAHDSGVASATMNASQQVGASLGTALLNTIAASRTADYLASHEPSPQAGLAGLVDGYALATGWSAGILAAAGVLAFVLINARLDAPAGGAASTVQDEHTGVPDAVSDPTATHPDRGADPGAAADSARRRQPELVLAGAGQRIASESRPPDAIGTSRAPGRHTEVSAVGPAVRGTVYGPNGGQVAGAVLTLIEAGGHQVGRTVTDDTGGYRIDVQAPGSYVLIASAAAHRPEARPVMVKAGPIGLDVALTGLVSLAGVVTAVTDGLPIVSAAVSLADGQGEIVASLSTAADGSYSFTELMPGDYTLVLAADGFQPDAQTVTVPQVGLARHDVSLVSTAKVHGTVRSAYRQRPAEEARVSLLDSAGAVVAVTDTDEYGNYTIGNLAAGDYTLMVTGYPPTTRSLTVGTGQDGQHDVELRHSSD